MLSARTLSIGAPCLVWTPPVTAATAPGAGPDAMLIEGARRVAEIESECYPRFVDQGYLPGMGLGASYPFLAWARQPGATLRHRLQSGPLELTEAVDLAIAIAEALHWLHRAGRHHGWLCPAVVYLCDDGRLQLLLAGVGDVASGESPEPVNAYRAPEQLPERWRPPTVSAAGPASDLWALGVLLHETIDGAPPFVGDTTEALAESIASGRRRPLAAAPELEPILASAMGADPEQRTSDARSLAHELRACRQLLPEPPTPRSAPESVARTRPSRPTASEQQLRGLLDHLRERREQMALEPRLPLWQLLLPPTLLAALVLLTAWLLWQAA